MPRSAELWRPAVFFAAYFAAAGVQVPYFPLYLESRGLTAAEVGLLMAAAQTTRIIGPNFWGWVADHSGRRTRIVRATAWAACALFALLLVPGGFGWVLLAFTASQFCGTGQVPVTESIVASRLRGDVQAAARYGRMRVWGSVGFIATVLAAGPLFDRAGIVLQPWLALAFLLLVALAALLLREAPPGDSTQASVPVGARLAEPRVRWFFLSVVLMIFAHGAMYAYLSLHLAQLGYSTSTIGVLWVLGVVAEIAVFYLQGWLFRRWGVYPLLLATFFAAILRFVLTAEVAQSLALLVFAQLLHGMTFAMHHSASILTVQRWFSGRAAARGQALYVSLGYGVGGTLGGLMAAWLCFRFSTSAAFLSSSVAAALGVIAVWRAWRLDRAAVTSIA